MAAPGDQVLMQEGAAELRQVKIACQYRATRNVQIVAQSIALTSLESLS